MLSLLDYVQKGICIPSTLQVLESTKRLQSLQLSKNRDFEKAHSGGINCLDLEKVENRFLLSGGTDGGVFIYDLHNGDGVPRCTYKAVGKIPRKSRHAHRFSVEMVQWYPYDTGIFITSSMDGNMKIWDSNRLKPADSYNLGPRIFCHHMSPIATRHCLIAAGTSSKAVLVDIKSGACSHELRGHDNKVLSIQWSPFEENLLATGGSDNRLILWDIRSAKGYLRILDQHNGEEIGERHKARTAHNGAVHSVCFSSDGLYLLSYGTDGFLRLWDVAKSKNTMVNYGKFENDNPKHVQLAVYCDSNPNLVILPSENNVCVLGMHEGNLISTLRGHFNYVNCCIVHPHYQEVFSGGNDRNILLWTPDLEQETLYEDYLRKDVKDDKSTKANPFRFGLVQRNVTADDWSSDED